MRFDRSIVSQLAAALLIGLALVACSGGVATSKTQNAIVVTVEPSLVADELRLATNGPASLDALLARRNGTVLFELDQADAGKPQGIGVAEAWRALDAAGRLVLACAAMTWTSSDPADSTFPLTGCEVDVAFGTLGSRTLLLSRTDP